MSELRSVLIGFNLLVNILCIGLVSYSLAGFSFNQAAVRSAYWAYANLPAIQVHHANDDYALGGLNLEYFYGLRLQVRVCGGQHCNDKGGDDFSQRVTSQRIQNCYTSDDDNDNSEVVCYSCRNAGLTAGAALIFAYFLLLLATASTALRLNREGLLAITAAVEGSWLKMSTIVLHCVATCFLIISLSVYSGLCYSNLRDLYSDDDAVDGADVAYFLGPGFIVLIAVLLLQPVVVAFHLLVPAEPDDGSSSGSRGRGNSSSGGMANQQM